jgi:hypothetical protein
MLLQSTLMNQTQVEQHIGLISTQNTVFRFGLLSFANQVPQMQIHAQIM